jgi:hypothetical protein
MTENDPFDCKKFRLTVALSEMTVRGLRAKYTEA